MCAHVFSCLGPWSDLCCTVLQKKKSRETNAVRNWHWQQSSLKQEKVISKNTKKSLTSEPASFLSCSPSFDQKDISNAICCLHRKSRTSRWEVYVYTGTSVLRSHLKNSHVKMVERNICLVSSRFLVIRKEVMLENRFKDFIFCHGVFQYFAKHLLAFLLKNKQ